jgi:hypothetical protein
MLCVLCPLTFVGAARSPLATEEKRKTKQHTTTPATAAFVENRPPIVADGASTRTQSEAEHMGR